MWPWIQTASNLHAAFLNPNKTNLWLDLCRSVFISSGMGTLPRATSHCSTLPYQRSSYGLSTAALYVDAYRVSGEPVFSHRHSGLVDRVATRTPSIESIHKDPRYSHTTAHADTQYVDIEDAGVEAPLGNEISVIWQTEVISHKNITEINTEHFGMKPYSYPCLCIKALLFTFILYSHDYRYHMFGKFGNKDLVGSLVSSFESCQVPDVRCNVRFSVLFAYSLIKYLTLIVLDCILFKFLHSCFV